MNPNFNEQHQEETPVTTLIKPTAAELQAQITALQGQQLVLIAAAQKDALNAITLVASRIKKDFAEIQRLCKEGGVSFNLSVDDLCDIDVNAYGVNNHWEPSSVNC
jgi:hypothetical protein